MTTLKGHPNFFFIFKFARPLPPSGHVLISMTLNIFQISKDFPNPPPLPSPQNHIDSPRNVSGKIFLDDLPYIGIGRARANLSSYTSVTKIH